MSGRTVVLAVDPGPTESAYVIFDGTTVERAETEDNAVFIDRSIGDLCEVYQADVLAVEMVACYGMPVGADVFETCTTIGHIEREWAYESMRKHSCRVYRKDVKLHLCGQPRAKDANIRQALIDRFGPGKAKAVGKKKTPGPLYGVKSHQWAALAVAVTWWDTMRIISNPTAMPCATCFQPAGTCQC